MEDEANAWKVFGDPQPRRKVVFVGVHQPSRIPQLAADENGRNAVIKYQVGIGAALVVQRTGVFVAKAEVERGGRRRLPAIFGERPSSPRAQIHRRHASLALLHGGQAEQHAGQSGTSAIIEAELRGVTGGVLVVAAILEETPHRPDILVELAAEFHAVASTLTRRGIPKL